MADKQGIKATFTAHPATVGETWGEHFVAAMGFSLALFRAALVCAVHAVFPFLFEKTGSECIADLHHRMVTHRDTRAIDARGQDAANSKAPASTHTH